MKLFATETRNYSLAVLGINETRRSGTGQRRLTTGELLQYSGHGENRAPHTQGVAV